MLDTVDSKMGLVHEDDVDCFLTHDKTHHEFSTVGAKGGAAAGWYINPSFPGSGEQCIVSNTTGVWRHSLWQAPAPSVNPEHGFAPRG